MVQVEVREHSKATSRIPIARAMKSRAAEPMVDRIGTAKCNLNHNGRTRARNRVRAIIENRLEQKTLRDIMENARLTEKEIGVVRVYIMAKNPPSLQEVADRLGYARITIAMAIREIENKLLGKNPHEHRRARYERFGDRRLRKAIRGIGAETRSELRSKNEGLFLEVTRRGLLDEIYPPKKRKFDIVGELKDEIQKLLQKISKSKAYSCMTPLQKAITKKIALRDEPDYAYFENRHSMSRSAVEIEARRLLHMIRRLNANEKPHIRIRHTVWELGAETIARLRRKMSRLERDVLDSRAMAAEPLDFRKIGSRNGYGNAETPRQVELKLLAKLEAVQRGESWKTYRQHNRHSHAN